MLAVDEDRERRKRHRAVQSGEEGRFGRGENRAPKGAGRNAWDREPCGEAKTADMGGGGAGG